LPITSFFHEPIMSYARGYAGQFLLTPVRGAH
jgi:hypothetical protein